MEQNSYSGAWVMPKRRDFVVLGAVKTFSVGICDGAPSTERSSYVYEHLKENKTHQRLVIFIIYKIMKYRKILIKYNAYLKKAVFHSRENIKSCIFTAVKI